jgi:hypothetical protein
LGVEAAERDKSVTCILSIRNCSKKGENGMEAPASNQLKTYYFSATMPFGVNPRM